MAEKSYVLGTYDEEIERLGLQHRVWRSRVTDCWARAGITVGKKVLDVGAGPGYASIDLAQIVGHEGKVLALELSDRFVETGRARAQAVGLENVEFSQCDLVNDQISDANFDFAWCRWVMSFVSDPSVVIGKVANALKTGGKFVLHEYLEYGTWGFIPPRPEQTAFQELTMKNWRDAGGEPNIGFQLPKLLAEAGFTIETANPILFCMRPGDYAWQWATAWVKSSGKRLVESGELSQDRFNLLVNEFAEAESNPESLMLIPSVFEIIARKQ